MSSAGLGRTLRSLRDLLCFLPCPSSLHCCWRSWLRQLVADRLRLPRHAVGTCARAARRRVDLPGADARGRVGGQSCGLPAGVHPGVRPPCVAAGTVAAWLWLCVLGVAMFGSMWILGVRDWRCLVLAVTSPVVVHGLWYGNLTVLLVLPIALAWRCRDRARLVGIAVGAAVAAKLFVWPLVVWLLLTRRFRAAAWAAGSAVVLALGAWALVGFQGMSDYPSLLRAVQDVYAVRSLSVSTVAGALGASVPAAVAVAAVVGLACLALAAWLVRNPTATGRVRDRRGRVHSRLADRLAQLRRPVRPDRDHLATSRPCVVLRVRRVARRSTGPRSRSDAYSASTPRCRRAGLALEPHVACGMGSRCDVLGRRCGRPDRRILSPSSLGISNIRRLPAWSRRAGDVDGPRGSGAPHSARRSSFCCYRCSLRSSGWPISTTGSSPTGSTSGARSGNPLGSSSTGRAPTPTRPTRASPRATRASTHRSRSSSRLHLLAWASTPPSPAGWHLLVAAWSRPCGSSG